MHKDGRSWRQLANVIAGLPDSSHFRTAQRNDPEIAERVAEELEIEGAEGPKWAPRPEEWDLLHELLAANFDRVGDLIAAVINTTPGIQTKVKPPDRYPRPETEIDRARRRFIARTEDDLEDLIAQAHANWEAAQVREQGGGTVTPPV